MTAIIVERSGNNEDAYASDNDFVDIELAEESKEPSPGTYYFHISGMSHIHTYIHTVPYWSFAH